MNILIIDDENTSRMAMEAIFSDYGFCEVFATGKEAIAAYKDLLKKGSKYDLIILDISLENESGLDVLKTIRKLEKKAGMLTNQDRSKIIMATGNSSMDMVKECIKEKCNDYIVKPIRSKVIAPKMEKFNFKPLGNGDSS